MCNSISLENVLITLSAYHTAINFNEEFKQDQTSHSAPAPHSVHPVPKSASQRLGCSHHKECHLSAALYQSFPWGQNLTQIKRISVCSLGHYSSALERCLVAHFLNAKPCPHVLCLAMLTDIR